nr:hypothetical protein [Streptomyces colonosanans]
MQLRSPSGRATALRFCRHVKCIDGRQEVANRKIDELLREYE